MIRSYVLTDAGLRVSAGAHGEAVLDGALWVDVISPTVVEDARVETELGIKIPSQDEMHDLETSARLYEEHGAVYMTATVATQLDSDRPQSSAVTFIATRERIITVRYCDPVPFQRYVAFAETHPASASSSTVILEGLLERIVERIAEVIERLGLQLDALSAEVFAIDQRHSKASKRDAKLREILRRIGQHADLLSKSRESLVSLGRLTSFARQQGAAVLGPDCQARLATSERDVHALADHASFVSSKINFLLDATLGYINIEQNGIIKIFSVAAVVFLPPTLIGTIYGMNFHGMPELDWSLGYPLALVGMVASAVLPYWYFNRRGWL